ncbi:MAG: DUF3089 domain-containing protein [Methanobrevibacter sp.]|jgi:hypothetical protein|nr:DUF3089 domain-containing protein [Methanobrevibacter sp.]
MTANKRKFKSMDSIDYSDTKNWLKIAENPQNRVDIFVLSPTTYFNPLRRFAPISSHAMRHRMQNFYDEQVAAFEKVGNIFFPVYRQASATILLRKKSSRKKLLSKVPDNDVLAAFNYYLENFNNGRPFIILGHSQGAELTANLIFNRLNSRPEILKKLVAAYIIGYSITPQDLEKTPSLHFATSARDFNAIVSFNVLGKDADAKKLVTWRKNSLAINPISWRCDETLASAGKNLSDARLDKTFGVIRVTTENTKLMLPNLPIVNSLFPFPSYHLYEVKIYQNSLVENITECSRVYQKSLCENI